jgi:hypothetical protein
MNPRYRRLLIPGLLLVLIVVVLITALAREARGAAPTRSAAAGVVSTISDPRIVESSGLVLSNGHRDLAYTINDSGNAAVVYAIRVSTGKVVGTTQVTGGALLDTEALSIDNDGTLWIADTGDNNETRSDAALYALPEQGEGAHSVQARRYPVSYADGPHDVEALLINPNTNEKFLVSKDLLGGTVYPADSLKSGAVNTLTPLDADVPSLVTDGAFTPDGRHAVLRTYGSMRVYDAEDWKPLRTDSLPPQEQGETLATEEGSVLIGSEGAGSQLLRVRLRVDADVPVTAKPTATTGTASSEAYVDSTLWGIGIAVIVVVVAAGLVIRRRG